MALARDDVQELRALQLAHVGERRHQRVDVVAVDRADVVEAELLEQRAGQHHALDVLLRALGELVHRRQLATALPCRRGAPCCRAATTAASRGSWLSAPTGSRDRHVVVVQDHEQVGAAVPALLSASNAMPALIAPSPITATTRRVLALAAARRPPCRAPRRSTSTNARCRTCRIRSPRGAESPTGRRHWRSLRHRLAPAGQDLVRVGLVADVPDDAVVRRVEDVVQRDRELDGAEVRRQVAAGLRDRIEQERAQLARELAQLARGRARAGRRGRRCVRAAGTWQVGINALRSTIQSASSRSRRAAPPKRRERRHALRRAAPPRAALRLGEAQQR